MGASLLLLLLTTANEWPIGRTKQSLMYSALSYAAVKHRVHARVWRITEKGLVVVPPAYITGHTSGRLMALHEYITT